MQLIRCDNTAARNLGASPWTNSAPPSAEHPNSAAGSGWMRSPHLFSQYRYPLANASEFARGHQACGTGSDDDDMVCVLFGHAGSFTGVSCDRSSHCCIMGRGYCTPGQLRD